VGGGAKRHAVFRILVLLRQNAAPFYMVYVKAEAKRHTVCRENKNRGVEMSQLSLVRNIF
jgi:hypothetical protein